MSENHLLNGSSHIDGTELVAAGLSKLAVDTLTTNPPRDRYSKIVESNRYHPQNNPEGIVPFGGAENKVALQILKPKLIQIQKEPEGENVYSYANFTGDYDFRQSLKRFLEDQLRPLQPLDVESLQVMDGVTVALENFAFALADPGEYFMVLSPHYEHLALNFYDRPKVLTLPVHPYNHKSKDCRNNNEWMDVSVLENALVKAKRQGKIVRAIHIANPDNPTGDVYTKEELEQILEWADGHSLHVIVNESYALSVYDPDVTFTSILSIPHPDPHKVHFTWGFSKDFGLGGLWTGVMYSRHPGVIRYFGQTAPYRWPRGSTQLKLRLLVEDLGFINKVFKLEIRKIMVARYKTTKEAIEAHGGRVHASPATCFRWVDLSSFLQRNDWEGEHELFLRLLNGGVYMLAGRSLGSSEPGWFRMVVALEEDVHSEGIGRLVTILENIRNQQRHHQQDIFSVGKPSKLPHPFCVHTGSTTKKYGLAIFRFLKFRR